MPSPVMKSISPMLARLNPVVPSTKADAGMVTSCQLEVTPPGK